MYTKLVAALGVLVVSGASSGKTVNITDFTFSGPVAATITGGPVAGVQSVAAGEFKGTLDGASFNAYCAELDQSFNLGSTYSYDVRDPSTYFTPQKADALSRLFTATAGFVTDADTSGAMQAGIWEILYETGGSFNVSGGSFKTAPAPNDAGAIVALAAINGILGNLGQYMANVQVDVLYNATAQNFVVVHEVPEPGTWALMFAGLGVVGAVAHRRKVALRD